MSHSELRIQRRCMIVFVGNPNIICIGDNLRIPL